jgi:hypothetical protein
MTITIFSTYCSKEKREDKEDINSIDRYISNRILKVFKSSIILDTEFRILSGEFGLLKADDKIPYYDHLLIKEELPEYINKLYNQLKDTEVKQFILFSESLLIDPNLEPYQIAIKTVCERLNIDFFMIDLSKKINLR